MDQLKRNIIAVKQRIASAAEATERDPETITLIAASKTRTNNEVEAAYAAGLRHFGENYIDEGVGKITALNRTDAVWHFIGRVQSNKTRLLAEHFDWVHTIDRMKIAQRLSDQRTASRPLQVLLQVNIDRDPAKAGMAVDQVTSLAADIVALPNLQLRGLMTILSQAADPGASYESMAQLARQIDTTLPAAHRPDFNVLSMGMSGDLEAAIHAGATHVRIGTALFGERGTR